MKRLLLLSVLALFLSTTSWAYDFSVNGFYFNVYSSSERTCHVTYASSYTSGNSIAYKGDLTIPNSAYYAGYIYSVAGIGASAFHNCSGITSVSIPTSVTLIRQWAFENCTGLTGITIPSGMEEIEGNAFSGCSGINEVVLNAEKYSGSTSGTSVFKNCSSLLKVIIGANVTETKSMFKDLTTLTYVEYNATSCTSTGIFSGCKNLYEETDKL